MCGLLLFLKSYLGCLTTFQFVYFQFQAFYRSKTENPWILLQLFMGGSSKLTLDLWDFPPLIFQNYRYTFDKTEYCNYLKFCWFSRIRRHHRISPWFPQGKRDISIVFRGCCEIIDIPVRKRISKNHHSTFFTKKRVISAHNFIRNLSRKKLGDPLTREKTQLMKTTAPTENINFESLTRKKNKTSWELCSNIFNSSSKHSSKLWHRERSQENRTCNQTGKGR